MNADTPKNASTSKQSFFSWSISPDELRYQTKHYSSLGVTQSYRGVSVLIMLGVLAITFILYFFGAVTMDGYMEAELLIYAVALYFVYKGGHRWALILVMLLWTLDKVATLYSATTAGTNVWWSIVWWFAVMPYLYKALRVENERINLQPEVIRTEAIRNNTNKMYCPKCGGEEERDTKFCTHCGFNLEGVSVS